ncbi:MAG: V-type ATP synthase subunit D, partial [Victivallales bacterium]|nr:V-type ATP synthase subunit D [Victivallales bacterium]
TGTRNVAGIDVPVFESLELDVKEYDLFTTAPWFEDAVELVREKIELELKKRLLLETSTLLEQELRVVTQRVNLFEKVMIPNARENIRVINIYLGDQQTNSVGRSKIAKGKCAARDANIA